MPLGLTLAQLLALFALLCAATACAGRPRAEQEPPIAPPRDGAAPAVTTATVSTTPPQRSEPSANLLVSDTEYQGWRYYHLYCDRCHGQDALGTLDAPNLRHSITPEGGVSADSFFVMVRNGSSNKEMPSFHELLDDQQIRGIYAYVSARSENRLAAGRPRRAATAAPR